MVPIWSNHGQCMAFIKSLYELHFVLSYILKEFSTHHYVGVFANWITNIVHIVDLENFGVKKTS